MRLASPLSNTTHYREFFFFSFLACPSQGVPRRPHARRCPQIQTQVEHTTSDHHSGGLLEIVSPPSRHQAVAILAQVWAQVWQ
mmetsp:Transcript_5233/g.5748  ORF Transcript_5233/g.5748 Transcript_5233/m.5748 type:complete len:83 (-) Transcript_5233:42-290(-)